MNNQTNTHPNVELDQTKNYLPEAHGIVLKATMICGDQFAESIVNCGDELIEEARGGDGSSYAVWEGMDRLKDLVQILGMLEQLISIKNKIQASKGPDQANQNATDTNRVLTELDHEDQVAALKSNLNVFEMFRIMKDVKEDNLHSAILRAQDLFEIPKDRARDVIDHFIKESQNPEAVGTIIFLTRDNVNSKDVINCLEALYGLHHIEAMKIHSKFIHGR